MMLQVLKNWSLDVSSFNHLLYREEAMRRHFSWPPEDGDASQFCGCWVALDNCRYDTTSGQPVEGDVVDSDEDLAELCARLNQSSQTKCVVLFCDEDHVIRPTRPPEMEFDDSGPHSRPSLGF